MSRGGSPENTPIAETPGRYRSGRLVADGVRGPLALPGGPGRPLFFVRAQQAKVKRPPIIQYTVLPRDVTFYLLAAALAWLFLHRTRRRSH